MKVDKWTGNEIVSINDLIKVLNDLIEIDPVFMEEFISTRVSCNHKMRDHETVQCHCYGDASIDKPKAGFLGILNGLIGIDKSHFGPIAAYYSEESRLISFGLSKYKENEK